MVKKRKDIQETTTYDQPVILEEAGHESELLSCLKEIRNYDGVNGYILRDSTSASIDLKDPTKIVDYAIFSSSSIDAAKELAKIFDIGEMKNTVFEGKNAKMLSLVLDANKISVFMEKNADTEKIIRKLSPL